MSVMGFQKKFGWGVGGWGELYPIFWDFWNFVYFAKPLSTKDRDDVNGLRTYSVYTLCLVREWL